MRSAYVPVLAGIVVLLALVLVREHPGGEVTRAYASFPTEGITAGLGTRPPADAIAPGHVTEPVVRASSGCSNKARPAAQPGSTVSKQLTSGGLKRDYRVHTGAAVTDGKPVPVLLNFHGRSANGAEIESFSGFLPISDREGFLLVSPDGTGSPRGWGAGASLSDWPVDDIAFVRELVNSLKSDYCIDVSRIYADGHSNGAFMASRLACQMSDDIAAIAPVAGIYLPGEACGGPVPVLAIHGTADDVVPYGGGIVREVYQYRGVEPEFAAWAAHNGCAPTPVTRALSPSLTLETRAGCAAATELLVISGADHGWPDLAAYGTTPEPGVAERIWAFFKDKRSAAAV